MGYTRSSLLSVALVLAFCSSIQGLDITKLLGEYPEYAQFNKYLTETKLADQINSRNAVTVLALDDAAMASLSGKSQDAVKAILSTHVLVNFYDEKKLMEAEGSRTKVETLFQSSGVAKPNQGYIYVALINEGEIAFGSAAAAPNAPFEVVLVRSVTSQPDTVSADGAGDNIAQSPSALAPGPSSDASRVYMGLFGAASAIASLVMLAL
ncbi:Fasciclin-like arabinogalactan protein 14 [Glycine soja]|uniref:Fasciclin-like arabinogalactan protein 14 n=1 Tax=Glycine soja TaxID=3848 RepID=A0A0B2Q4H4_GLYSO|nr:Fasciclin-like arabinogalactan protein 14 [Glycine soja]